MKLKTQFEFDAAHRLVGYEGKCSQLHGHRWLVEVEVSAVDVNLDDVGILFDFNTVKDIEKVLDHKTLLKVCKENQDLVYALTKTCGSDCLLMMDNNPTAENLSLFILDKLRDMYVDLKYRVRVYESPKSYAEVEG